MGITEDYEVSDILEDSTLATKELSLDAFVEHIADTALSLMQQKAEELGEEIHHEKSLFMFIDLLCKEYGTIPITRQKIDAYREYTEAKLAAMDYDLEGLSDDELLEPASFMAALPALYQIAFNQGDNNFVYRTSNNFEEAAALTLMGITGTPGNKLCMTIETTDDFEISFMYSSWCSFTIKGGSVQNIHHCSGSDFYHADETQFDGYFSDAGGGVRYFKLNTDGTSKEII